MSLFTILFIIISVVLICAALIYNDYRIQQAQIQGGSITDANANANANVPKAPVDPLALIIMDGRHTDINPKPILFHSAQYNRPGYSLTNEKPNDYGAVQWSILTDDVKKAGFTVEIIIRNDHSVRDLQPGKSMWIGLFERPYVTPENETSNSGGLKIVFSDVDSTLKVYEPPNTQIAKQAISLKSPSLTLGVHFIIALDVNPGATSIGVSFNGSSMLTYTPSEPLNGGTCLSIGAMCGETTVNTHNVYGIHVKKKVK
jgi:hypothetical protein